jgi:hypothetical protein
MERLVFSWFYRGRGGESGGGGGDAGLMSRGCSHNVHAEVERKMER